MKTNELAHALADVIATHQLLQHTERSRLDTRARQLSGAILATLGFAYGPELYEKLKSLNDQELSDIAKQRALYTAAGAVAGGVAAYIIGKEVYDPNAEARKARLQQPLDSDLERELADAANGKPNGLLSIAAAGWLGYSLLIREQTEDARDRLIISLGAGVLGYLFGPELIQKTNELVIPAHVKEDAMEAYARGMAGLGIAAGGVAGFYLSQRWLTNIAANATIVKPRVESHDEHL